MISSILVGITVFIAVVFASFMFLVFLSETSSDGKSEWYLVILALVLFSVSVWIGIEAGTNHYRDRNWPCVKWVEAKAVNRVCRSVNGGEAICEDIVNKTCVERRAP